MADFMDREAEVSDGSDEDDHLRERTKKKKPSRRVHDSSEEEDEEDEEKLREEMKDMINDEPEEEEADSDDDINRKRKHGDDDEDSVNDDLDDEDLALLEENLGEKFVPKKKKLKRVVRLTEEESDTEETDAKEALANELFDGDDENVPSTSQRRDDRGPQGGDDRYGAISGSEESDDEDNFIVDDEDRPIARPRKRKGQHRYNDEAMQQAQDIFGVDFDFEDLEAADQEEYEDEQDEDDYEDEGDEGDRSFRRKKGGRKKSSRKSIYDIYEPSELERSHLTEFDTDVKTTDFPERFQLRGLPVQESNDETQFQAEADWIHKHAFNTPTISLQGLHQTHAPLAGHKDASIIPKICEAVKFIRHFGFEVPFIASYRREYFDNELNMRDLWAIYKWDEKFCQLQQRKERMLELYKDMQMYQSDRILTEMNANAVEGARLINEHDIFRVSKIDSFEQLHDTHLHFQLYYSADLPAMKQQKEKREIQRLREERLAQKQAERGEGDGDVQLDEEEEEQIASQMSKIKLAARKDFYTICKEAGLIKLAELIGMTPEQLGENIQSDYQMHEPKQHDELPSVAAEKLISNRFPTVENVLQAMRYVVAKQISCDPIIRKCVREIFLEKAVVHVRPTKKGLKEKIDENHPCYTRKYLKNKRIRDFAKDSFLQLLIAEKDGLLEVKITVDEKDSADKSHLEKIFAFYYSDGFSDLVRLWNTERQGALDIAFNKMLYPALEKELKAKMRQEALDAILMDCGAKLRSWINVAPYTVDPQITEDEDFDIRDGVRVMGFAFMPQTDQSAFAAMIDGDGEVTDHLRLPNFMLRGGEYAPKSEQDLKRKDQERLKNFILSKKPHVIALGSETLDARRVHRDITDVVQALVDNEQFPAIRIEIVDNELSSIYMNSKRGKTDFHDFPDLLRQAVSLARRLQEPLVEFSQLCTPEEEILCLKYHPLQDQLPKEELLLALNIEFINVVNDVGVDVNRAIVHPHTAQLVQFVAGLGARKASALLRTLKKQQTPILESRTQLIMNCKFGAKVFINCAGFIKIDTAQLADTGTDTYIEVLDSTRVHPEAYEWARKMAVDALEYDDENESNPAGALEEILENPEKLKDLDLDAFAEELQRQGFGDKSVTLYSIRDELSNRYKETREHFRSANEEELFQMLTKETPETLFEGKLVMGTVSRIARKAPDQEQLDGANPIRDDDTNLWKCPFCSKNDFPELSEVWNHFDAKSCPGKAFGVNVRLDNGINGFIKTEKLSDKAVTDPADRVVPGMTIHARITKVLVDKFSVDLTCRGSDLNDIGFDFRAPKDDNFDYEQERADQEAEVAAKKKHQRPHYAKRIIVHPSFKNIGFKAAELALADLAQGEAIIRPSSKGQNHLTLTWKVHDGITQHIDIREEEKDNPFSLGRKLIINNEAFEDLDEIIARFVQPMASLAREVANFRYFRSADGGNKELLTRLLEDEKRKQPAKIHYFISASKDHPGSFVLSYLPRNKVMHEYVTVSYEGLIYRKKTFRSISSLFRWFKEHFRDPIPRPTPQATPQNQTPGPYGPDGTPSMQAIHRAAAAMPNQMFNQLSQVNVQTPSNVTPVPGAYGASRESQGSLGGFYSQTTPGPPITPTYGGAAGARGTPRGYSNTTPQGGWAGSSGGMPPPSQPPRRSASRSAGAAWSDIAEDWDRPPRQPKTPSYNTPGASSQMSISPTSSPNFKGDQTPLVDEWN